MRSKRTEWTEHEVRSAFATEHDHFERKSGLVLDGADRKTLAKAVSALCNSGGGHILIGAENDGSFRGVKPSRGRTPVREWTEQIVPNLVDYPLEDFRVHEVVRVRDSAIPPGKALLVIDIGDSVLAPHQSSVDKVYYYRQAGHSVPAPHFYLETLRNRLTRPVLVARLSSIKRVAAYPHDGGVFVEMRLAFEVKNEGHVAAYKWHLVVESYSDIADDRDGDYVSRFAAFPRGGRSRSSSFALDDSLLPGLSRTVELDLGVMLRASPTDPDGLRRDLHSLFPPASEVRYRVVTETSRGESASSKIAPVLDVDSLIELDAS